ncbi:hypothetical protein B9P99_01030 [Candidatus Marsarchaeota G1 archaeon OSP_B]|uniref:Uncharacterized protein n=2 Tax=Candidatus Marsarchaeota group 1 TaxID=2203770 RepID=A0A2R6AAR8_9ARCH|nr:MAG: hypothetical protein B9Q02_10460 [Candidatus Marsarchaeota G1 archaeon BE_D]PSN95452.1 MAG: hypothetical protein B9P99_01030 [Candidatus Marsarchaeota G1 archaeon OSP_B]
MYYIKYGKGLLPLSTCKKKEEQREVVREKGDARKQRRVMDVPTIHACPACHYEEECFDYPEHVCANCANVWITAKAFCGTCGD